MDYLEQQRKEKESQEFIIPWGKHAGSTLKDIALKDINYLDYLADSPNVDQETKKIIKTFLGIQWVDRLNRKGYRQYTEPKENIKVIKKWWEK